MMQLDAPIAAFRPFLSSSVRVFAETGRYTYAEPFTVPACVMQTDPYTIEDNAGEHWAVSVAVEDLAGRTILPGAKIEAENVQLLFVQSVHRNGPLIVCDCTAKQRPKGGV